MSDRLLEILERNRRYESEIATLKAENESSVKELLEEITRLNLVKDKLEAENEKLEKGLANEHEAATFWQTKATFAENELAAAREEAWRAGQDALELSINSLGEVTRTSISFKDWLAQKGEKEG